MARKRSYRAYTDEDFSEAIKNSQSIRKTLEKIGLRPTGGNYQVAKRRIKMLGLDTSHFSGQAHLKGKTHNWAPKTPTEEILVENCTWGGSTSSLRKRLIKEGYFEPKCYNCQNTKWMDNKIPLELEHVNGDRFDNQIENLTLLCPNCHALTSTYRGKNSKSKRLVRHQSTIKKERSCLTCKSSISKGSKSGLCINCYRETQRKVKRPSKTDLQKDIEELGYLGTGRKYGVSDNAIRKWMK